MNEQDTLVENEEKPGAIPNRPLRYSELVEMKIYAQNLNEMLSAMAGFLETFNLADDDGEFEDPKIRLTDTGILCDDIVKFCNERLKKMDAKKAGKL